MIEQKIILGDAVAEMEKLPSENVDLIIADPPYNLGKNYGNNHDIKGFEEYLEFSRSWLTEAHRILKPSGTIYVFMGFRFISYLYDILERDLKMFLNSWIVWHYTQGIGKKKGFSPRHDDILMFTKSKNFIFHLDDVRVPKNIIVNATICAVRILEMYGNFLMCIIVTKIVRIIRLRSLKV